MSVSLEEGRSCDAKTKGGRQDSDGVTNPFRTDFVTTVKACPVKGKVRTLSMKEWWNVVRKSLLTPNELSVLRRYWCWL